MKEIKKFVFVFFLLVGSGSYAFDTLPNELISYIIEIADSKTLRSMLCTYTYLYNLLSEQKDFPKLYIPIHNSELNTCCHFYYGDKINNNESKNILKNFSEKGCWANHYTPGHSYFLIRSNNENIFIDVFKGDTQEETFFSYKINLNPHETLYKSIINTFKEISGYINFFPATLLRNELIVMDERVNNKNNKYPYTLMNHKYFKCEYKNNDYIVTLSLFYDILTLDVDFFKNCLCYIEKTKSPSNCYPQSKRLSHKKYWKESKKINNLPLVTGDKRASYCINIFKTDSFNKEILEKAAASDAKKKSVDKPLTIEQAAEWVPYQRDQAVSNFKQHNLLFLIRPSSRPNSFAVSFWEKDHVDHILISITENGMIFGQGPIIHKNVESLLKEIRTYMLKNFFYKKKFLNSYK